MLVQCPKCKTTYKVADEVLKDSSPAFRCSRCTHTFQIEAAPPPRKPDASSPSHERPVAPSGETSELSFSFPPKHEAEEIPTEVPGVGDSTPNFESATAASDPSTPWAINPADQKPDEPFTISESAIADQKPQEQKPLDPTSDLKPPPPADAPMFPPAENGENILRLNPYRDQQASTKPYLSLCGLLIVFFGIVTAFSQVHPRATEGFVRNIPLVGSSVLKNNRLKDGVLLQSLRAGYQSIQGNRELFVITGAALNQNPVTIRSVQISGQVFNDQGAEIEQQTAWIGNAISPSIVRGLTLQEITNLQRLSPLRSFEIPPGDSVTFTLVFLKAPKGVKDFGCKVVSAEGDA